MRYFIESLFCICFACLLLYKSIDNRNSLTELQLAIPTLINEVQIIQEQNLDLMYQIENFENPRHLMSLAKDPKYQHLKPKTEDKILFVHLPSKVTSEFAP